jgi:hypothetical protein
MHDNITCLQMLPNQNQTTRQSTCKLNAWSINQIAIVHAWTETRACTRRNHAWRWHPVQIFPPAQNSRRPCLFSIRDDSQQPPEHRQQKCQQHAVSVLSWLLLQAFDSPATEQSSMRAPPGFSAWDQSDAFEPEKWAAPDACQLAKCTLL